jgi:biotin carboxylase
VNPDRTLLLTGGSSDALRAARSLGLHVILIQHPTKFVAEQADLADVVFVADYTDWPTVAPLAEAAHRTWGFARAMCLTDPGIDAAGRVNDAYGLDGVSYATSRLFRDKLATRRLLNETGGVRVEAEPLTGQGDLAAFGAAHGYPFIVKPLDLAGSFGVFRVDGPDELAGAWERVRRTRAVGVDRGPSALFSVADFVLESYVDGPEFSVEAFSFAGRHVVVAITEKLTDEAHFAELGHALPARLDPEVESAIEATVHGLLDAVGYTDGPSHTELKVGRDGPVVIESHCRNAGDRVTTLVESAYGIDLTRLSFGWPFGLVEALPERPRATGGGCVRFLHAPPGRVEVADGITEVRAHPDVLHAELAARPGDRIRALENNWDRLGLVVTRGTDTDAAVKLCEDLIDAAVRIEVAS